MAKYAIHGGEIWCPETLEITPEDESLPSLIVCPPYGWARDEDGVATGLAAGGNGLESGEVNDMVMAFAEHIRKACESFNPGGKNG